MGAVFHGCVKWNEAKLLIHADCLIAPVLQGCVSLIALSRQNTADGIWPIVVVVEDILHAFMVFSVHAGDADAPCPDDEVCLGDRHIGDRHQTERKKNEHSTRLEQHCLFHRDSLLGFAAERERRNISHARRGKRTVADDRVVI